MNHTQKFGCAKQYEQYNCSIKNALLVITLAGDLQTRISSNLCSQPKDEPIMTVLLRVLWTASYANPAGPHH